MDRRGFLAGILALGMAPAVVKASSIMRVRPILLLGDDVLTFYEQTITIDQMRGVVDTMQRCHIPPDRDGYYHAFVHPSNLERVKCELGIWIEDRMDEVAFGVLSGTIQHEASQPSFRERVIAANKSILMRIPNG